MHVIVRRTVDRLTRAMLPPADHEAQMVDMPELSPHAEGDVPREVARPRGRKKPSCLRMEARRVELRGALARYGMIRPRRSKYSSMSLAARARTQRRDDRA